MRKTLYQYLLGGVTGCLVIVACITAFFWIIKNPFAQSSACSAPILSELGLTEHSKGEPLWVEHMGKKRYLSGVNVAWFRFSQDFGGGFDEDEFRSLLSAVRAAGGNTVRWWVHTDGAYTPEWSRDPDKQLPQVVGPGVGMIQDLQRALDLADQYEVLLVFSLWSFDMLRTDPYRTPPNLWNYQLLTQDEVRQSYIDYALLPMVQAVAGHPALLALELFNEPEIMVESWFAESDVFYGGPVPRKEDIQKTHGLFAAAIHREGLRLERPVKVTTGSKSLGKYHSDVAGGTNWYRDDRLIAAAAGDPLAILDFYQAHYYNNEGCEGLWFPFHHQASLWGLSKPIVIGEFHVHEPLGVLDQPLLDVELCVALKQKGYAGGWGWQWQEHPQELTRCLLEVAETQKNL